jgi:hypothetical protein
MEEGEEGEVLEGPGTEEEAEQEDAPTTPAVAPWVPPDPDWKQPLRLRRCAREAFLVSGGGKAVSVYHPNDIVHLVPAGLSLCCTIILIASRASPTEC